MRLFTSARLAGLPGFRAGVDMPKVLRQVALMRTSDGRPELRRRLFGGRDGFERRLAAAMTAMAQIRDAYRKRSAREGALPTAPPLA